MPDGGRHVCHRSSTKKHVTDPLTGLCSNDVLLKGRNADLWQRLHSLLDARRQTIEAQKVESHVPIRAPVQGKGESLPFVGHFLADTAAGAAASSLFTMSLLLILLPGALSVWRPRSRPSGKDCGSPVPQSLCVSTRRSSLGSQTRRHHFPPFLLLHNGQGTGL